MSTRQMQGRPREVTDRKYHRVTSVMWGQVNRMAGRTDLGMKVLERIPAPALFDPIQADIVLGRKLIEHLDPEVVASPDFAKKHPSLFGALVHESCHANQSRMDLARIHKVHGPRHHSVFMLLEEGRCEVNNYANLRAIEQAGLRACVLEIVLRDVNADDTEWQSAVRFVGLLAGRLHRGIVTASHPTIEGLVSKVRDVLGPYYREFYDLAVEFSQIEWSSFSNCEDQMHDVVRRWIELEDSIPPEDKGEGEGEDGSDGDESESEGQGQGQGQEGEDESSDGSGEGQGQPGEDEGQGSGSGGQGEGEAEDEAASNGAGDPSSGESAEGEGSSADRGVEGDGTNDESIEVTEHEGDDMLGNYNHADYTTVENLSDFIRDLADAAEQIKSEVMRSEIGPALRVEHHATQEAHKERRQRNKEAQALWAN